MNKYFKKQILIAGCLYIGQSLVGYVMGWTAPVIPKLQDPEQTPLENLITDAQASWIGSVFYVGCTIGPYISGYLSNVIGRKPCLFLGGCVSLLGFLLLALATNIALIFAGRVITGLGVGIMFVMNLVYIGEMASTEIRGILLTLTGFFSTLGTLIIFSLGPFVSYSMTGWVAVIISIVYIIGIYFIPESAMYQVLAGKTEEAKVILISLGREKDIIDVFETAKKEPTSKMAQVTEMVSIKSNRKALFIILALNILQQMSGVVAVIFFATTIFDLTGSTLESHISTIIIGVTQVFASAICPLFVDRAGRKLLLLISTSACSVSLAVLGIYFFLYNNDYSVADQLQWLSLLSLIVFFIAYDTGFGIIPNTFIGEMFTINARSFGAAFTVTIAWLVGFGVSTAFGYMVPAWGPDVTFWVYSGACAIAFIFSAVFVPETKGKTLLEIQVMLSK